MAGDWIKVEHATLDKPEVAYLSELLSVKVDEGLGILLRFWVWLDRNARNGCVTHVTQMSIDTTMHCPGFSAAIVTVGWAEIDEETRTLRVPNFARHNETPAKTRSSNADRQARYRDKRRNESNVTRNVTGVTTALPEKRREEKKEHNNIVWPPGFLNFWQSYPATRRRVAKRACLQAWVKGQCESMVGDVVAHVKAMRDTAQWRDGYEPAPLTYLNQRRWEDGPPVAAEQKMRGPSM